MKFMPTMTPELSVLANLLEAYDAEHNEYCTCAERGDFAGPCAPCVARVQLGIGPKSYECAAAHPEYSMFDGLVDRSKIPVCDQCGERCDERDELGRCRGCHDVAMSKACESAS